MDARLLSQKLNGQKIDRIETSNLADENYLGIKAVLNDWAPLLDINGRLLTYFMNWSVHSYRSEFQQFLLGNFENLSQQLKQKIQQKLKTFFTDTTEFEELLLEYLNISPIFLVYLENFKGFSTATHLGIEYCEINSLVPFRTGLSVQDSHETIPKFGDNSDLEKCYTGLRTIFIEWKK